MKNADQLTHPTRFTGQYPNGWAGFTFSDWDNTNKVYHPGDDYNWNGDKKGGDADLGQRVEAMGNGIVVHTSKSTRGYGNLIIIKHTLGYNMKRFIKETYGIETDELYSLYAHLQDILVAVGNEVDMGALIGHVGKSGTKWAHLHQEVYAPIGRMLELNWRDYPIGWSKEEIQKYYLSPYKLVESVKNMESYETFLGKKKDYWLAVEKDREDLMKQVGECDKKWALRLQAADKKYEQAEARSAKLEAKLTTLEEKAKLSTEAFEIELQKSKDRLIECQKRVSAVIEDNAENYRFWEAVKIAIAVIKKKIKL